IRRGSSRHRARGRTTHTDQGHRGRLHRAMTQDPTEVLDHAAARARAHASANRYEDAERLRRLALTYLTAARRACGLRAIGGTDLLIAARPSTEGVVGGKGCELLAVRHGRFTGAVLVPLHADQLAAARSLALT